MEQYFTGQMPFLTLNQSLEGQIIIIIYNQHMYFLCRLHEPAEHLS